MSRTYSYIFSFGGRKGKKRELEWPSQVEGSDDMRPGSGSSLGYPEDICDDLEVNIDHIVRLDGLFTCQLLDTAVG